MMSFFSLSVGWSLQTAEIKLKNDFIPTGSSSIHYTDVYDPYTTTAHKANPSCLVFIQTSG